MSDNFLSQEEIDALVEETHNQQAVDPMTEPTPENTETTQTPTIHMENAEPRNEQKGLENEVKVVQFAPLDESKDTVMSNGVDLILDVQLQVSVELGRSSMKVKDVLNLGPGSIVELDKHPGEPVEVIVNNKVVARGEVVVVDECFGVRITEIVSSKKRESNAKVA